MNTEIKNYLNELRFSEAQSHRNVTVVPLQAILNGAPAYIALADALERKTLIVTEVSEGGSVPQLLVLNDADQPVLVIDGEELLGAKQNRVLNTTILLKEKSRTIVPVTCTERGRWSYSSHHFTGSDAILERKIRSRKNRSVSQSLSFCAAPQSDQGEVWNSIQALHLKAECASPTSALHDVYQKQASHVHECLQAFPRVDGQVGLLVIINGRVVGCDLVTRPEVYARLHEKLIRSYVLDALLEQPTATKPVEDVPAIARVFLASLEQSREEVFPSVGYGQDHRYGSPTMAGNALLHEHHVIHAAFLTLEESAPSSSPDHMSALHRRRHFRQS